MTDGRSREIRTLQALTELIHLVCQISARLDGLEHSLPQREQERELGTKTR